MMTSPLRKKRGRPRIAVYNMHDTGTPELLYKRANGLTAEIIDTCRSQEWITPAQHWCALHFRWLYTLRFGTPETQITWLYACENSGSTQQSPEWRKEREEEYREAVSRLQAYRALEPVMQAAIYNDYRIVQHHERLATLKEGLELLCLLWKKSDP